MRLFVTDFVIPEQILKSSRASAGDCIRREKTAVSLENPSYLFLYGIVFLLLTLLGNLRLLFLSNRTYLKKRTARRSARRHEESESVGDDNPAVFGVHG